MTNAPAYFGPALDRALERRPSKEIESGKDEKSASPEETQRVLSEERNEKILNEGERERERVREKGIYKERVGERKRDGKRVERKEKGHIRREKGGSKRERDEMRGLEINGG